MTHRDKQTAMNSQSNIPPAPPAADPTASADVADSRTRKPRRPAGRRVTRIAVWILRVIIGGVFVMSGLVKAIDPWGFVFKLEDYLAVFGMDVPRSIVLTGAVLVCLYEFLFGFLLATGCCRRVAPIALTAMQAVMLPLTAYIAVANPVSDCGCFGDFWVISNTATFVKNIFITAALIYLIIKGTAVGKPVFRPAIQWLVEVIAALYLIGVSLIGYNIQPMVDFRPFAPGKELIKTDDTADDTKFIYEKDGRRETFDAYSLPGDDWTYVDRVEPDAGNAGHSLHILDSEGDDITADVLPAEGKVLICVIPEPLRADISYTYFLNELYAAADSSDIAMVALLGTGSKGIERWQDVSMAAYPCYPAEDTELKELARGIMSLVLADNGRVVSKATLSSLVGADAEEHPMAVVDRLALADSRRFFMRATALVAGVLVLIYMFQGLLIAARDLVRRKIRAHKERLSVKEHPADSR